ncbi:hypothetical protein SEA_CIRCINUS_15 [Streptomyces phage Circinus]|uniref:Uncharacterized protein n=1 Tax=Streptomyces phage Circinus TaxID=2562189 RepID=A0A4D6E0V1_9CAUD|nr:hypothetical protein SEA_CIRCINUS_15 [Streptomyces phage Circinus]
MASQYLKVVTSGKYYADSFFEYFYTFETTNPANTWVAAGVKSSVNYVVSPNFSTQDEAERYLEKLLK